MSHCWLRNMAGRLVILSVFLITILMLHSTSAMPRDIANANKENVNLNSASAESPNSTGSPPTDKPKSCFHFFVSRNMSSLLADATRMLRTIRDHQEREWILTFIHRIKSLAEHLRSHPDSKNYDCLPTDEDKKKVHGNATGQPQPELYFVDDSPKRSGVVQEEDKNSDNQSSEQSPTDEPSNGISPSDSESGVRATSSAAAENGGPSLVKEDHALPHPASHPAEAEINPKYSEQKKSGENVEDSIVLSSSPDCEAEASCQKNQPPPTPQHVSPEDYSSEASYSYPFEKALNNEELDVNEIELYEQEVLKDRIKNALLEELAPEVKKLRAVGGTPEDLLTLWNFASNAEEKQTDLVEDNDFDYEEIGAAAGDPNMHEQIQPDRTVAPSLGEVKSSKEKSKDAETQSYEPYDSSDVLVQQLFDVKYKDSPSKTTKSLGDQNEGYLISSTTTPF